MSSRICIPAKFVPTSLTYEASKLWHSAARPQNMWIQFNDYNSTYVIYPMLVNLILLKKCQDNDY